MAIPGRTSLFGHSTCTCMPVSVSIFVSCQLPLWPSSCHSDSKCHRSHGCQEDHEERSQGLQDNQGGAQDHGHQDQGPEEAGSPRHSSMQALGHLGWLHCSHWTHDHKAPNGPSRGGPGGARVAHRRPPHPEVPRVHQVPNFSPQGLYPDPLYPVRNPLAPEPARRRPGLAVVKPPRPGRQHPEARARSFCHPPPGGFLLKATGHSPMLRGKKVGVHFSMFSPQLHCLQFGV